MSFYERFKSEVFDTSPDNFQDMALALFDYQYRTNSIYQQYCQSLNQTPLNTTEILDIPFIPIEFFKDHQIKCESWTAEKTFLSSGTTQQNRSKCFVRDLNFYLDITKYTFELFYPKLEDLQLLALLPSYQEQGNSSLIAMVDHFMNFTVKGSGYFIHSGRELAKTISSDIPKALIGVSYALLDFDQPINKPSNLVVMETGGMKGRKKEMIREELHESLMTNFRVEAIHSEYGMTELTSQAYSTGTGRFYTPPWMKCLIRDINDPFAYLPPNKSGGINIIDLANISTCAFIQTKDLGSVDPNGVFSVIGRFDNSDIRGCNLLI